MILGNNFLSGTIPTEIGRFDHLKFLSIQGNQISGIIPSEIGRIQSFQAVYLSGNNLQGSVPTEIALCKELEYIDISSNDLSGPLPSGLFDLDLKSLNLNRNGITGTISTKIGHLINLEYSKCTTGLNI